MIGRINGFLLLIEAIFMLPSLMLAIVDKNAKTAWAFAYTLMLLVAFGGLLLLLTRRAGRGFYSKEGLVSVGLSWILLSLFGCLPFRFSGEIPRFIDALFEIVSGFTTTGASILSNVEALTRASMYWRCFSHWLGGMGVLVFLLAIAPIGGNSEGFTMHLLRAESPGPNVGKLVPKMRKTAVILYLIYIALTGLNVIFLLFGRMSLFDALCTAFATAGTGGFGIKNDSLMSYSSYIQIVCTVFMLLFGINFSCYYLLLLGNLKSVWKDEELRLYCSVVLGSIALITVNIFSRFGSLWDSLKHAAFQVSSIITTTGFVSDNFDAWPSFSKAILLCLMAIGACAGSTGGGLKCARVLLLIKTMRRNIRQMIHPNCVRVIRVNGNSMDERLIANTNAYFAVYAAFLVIGFLIVSLDQVSLITSFTSVLACFNNIGPGLDAVGPVCNYGHLNVASKITLIVLMLAGRLEIFPILILFGKNTWKRY